MIQLQRVISKQRFDNLAELRAIIDLVAGAGGGGADCILCDDGPSALILTEETLSDNSKVLNFHIKKLGGK